MGNDGVNLFWWSTRLSKAHVDKITGIDKEPAHRAIVIKWELFLRDNEHHVRQLYLESYEDF